MFTGIVEEVGTLRGVRTSTESVVLDIAASTVTQDTAVGESILTDGVCLTVTAVHAGGVTADAMPETVRRTTLGERVPTQRQRAWRRRRREQQRQIAERQGVLAL